MLTLQPRTVLSLSFAAVFSAVLVPLASAQTTVSSLTPPSDPTASTASPSPNADLRMEVERLEMLVRDQQKRIDALEAEHRTTPGTAAAATSGIPAAAAVGSPATVSINTDAAETASAALPVGHETEPTVVVGSAPTARPSSGQEAPPPQTVQAGSTDERVRNLERQIKGLGPVSFSGDMRLRGEPFFGGPTNESLDRFRARIRARFNVNADLGSQFKTGLTLASGDINDPTTTNQTLTGFYTRKAIALDQAYVEYTPDWYKHLDLIGGKFRYPWYNTELTWDKDLNPEGVAETLGYDINTPILKKIAFIGFQLPFAEVAGTSSTNAQHINQDVTYGGQIQTSWHIAPHVTLGAYTGYYNYHGADSIALALAKNSAKNPQTPLTGLLPLGTGNTVQNSIYTTTATSVVTIGGTAYPTGVTTVSSSQFASKFGLFDNIARFDIDTNHPKAPVSIIGDFVQNTEACGNLANILAAPKNTASLTYKQTVNFTCDSHYRRGYWAEARVGRLQQKGDFQIGYTRIYIEREAVLSNFDYSDIRQGSNVTQHRIDSFYQFDKNVQLGFTALIGRPLGTTEPWLTRLQFDAIYIF
jgi:Putative porin